MVAARFSVNRSNHIQEARADNACSTASQQLPDGWWKWQGGRQLVLCSHSPRLMSSFISPCLSFCLLAPLLLWKWIASAKWRNHALKKWKKLSTIPQRHIYFILKGRFEVTLQSFLCDIFGLDILWHFQLNIADIPAEELKARLKGSPALKLFPSIILPSLSSALSVHPKHSVPLLYVQQHESHTHYLLSVVDLYLQVLEEVVLIRTDYQKFLSCGKYETDTKCDWKEKKKQLMVLF